MLLRGATLFRQMMHRTQAELVWDGNNCTRAHGMGSKARQAMPGACGVGLLGSRVVKLIIGTFVASRLGVVWICHPAAQHSILLLFAGTYY